MHKKYNVEQDTKGRNVLIIDEICFTGRQRIKWGNVEEYLKMYVDKNYQIKETGDVIYISKEFPDEYSSSNDTARLKGTLAKAKANAVLGVPQIIENAYNKRYKENLAHKHRNNAKKGWFRYTSLFGLPIYDDNKIS